MSKRFVSIWFRHLKTDWFILRRPVLQAMPFVLALPDHGRMVITAANALAQAQGIDTGMAVADARALLPSLEVLDDKPTLSAKLLKGIAEWCIRYTPVVAIDAPDGLLLDTTGCAHLWGGEIQYVKHILTRLKSLGYTAHACMADTIGAAWGMAHFSQGSPILESGQQMEALLSLPPAALRLEADTIERLEKLGLRHVRNFIGIPRPALRRRFGQIFLQKLDQAIGQEEETIQPVHPIQPYEERLPCLEPIVTATGIEIALQRLLETLCLRLREEEKGLRVCCFKGYRVDGKVEKIEIGTNRPSHNIAHLFKLFEIKISTMEPALGIELFILDASKVEDASPVNTTLWETSCGLDDPGLSELLDRFAGKIGANHIHRYLPAEHHWPERSIHAATTLLDKPQSTWKDDRPRPLQLLARPEPIDVTAPIPDYPPMLFRHKGKLHKITRADGPERIEQEWWLQEGQHRDYYSVEDEEGHRYWLFRSGHYSADKTYRWFIHGFFA